MTSISKQQFYRAFTKLGFHDERNGVVISHDFTVKVTLVRLRGRQFIELSISERSGEYLGGFQLDGPNSPWTAKIRSGVIDGELAAEVAAFCKDLSHVHHLEAALGQALAGAGIVSIRLRDLLEQSRAAADRRS